MEKLIFIFLCLFILCCKEVPKRNSAQKVHEVGKVNENDEILNPKSITINKYDAEYNLYQDQDDSIKTLEEFKTEFLGTEFMISNEFNHDFNGDQKEDKLIILKNKNTVDCSDGKTRGENPILILEGTENNRYKLVIYSIEILPSDCSFGLAEPFLDISFENELFHFTSTFLSPSKQLLVRDYFFDKELNLNKILFKESEIGSEELIEKVIQKDKIGIVNLKEFRFEDFLENRF